jgi:hypothetical protein
MKTDEEDAAFHQAVMDALNLHGRKRPYSVPVAILMHFEVGIDKAPPQIDKLPKHYLDLMQAARGPDAIGGRKLLLDNDRLVKALICTYGLASYEGSTPHVSFEICTLKDFIHELLLYDKIVNRYLDSVPRDVRSLFIDRYAEDEGSRDAYRDYARALRQRDTLKGGNRLFADQMLPSLQEAAQSEILQRREHACRPDLPGVDKPAKYLARPLPINGQDDPTAVWRGNRHHRSRSARRNPRRLKSIRERVRNALTQMREAQPVFAPLLTTVGITVVYIPPLFGQTIDLDNLAMRIIPHVREELRPPATLLHALRNFKPAAIDQDLTEWLARLHRVEKIQITRYQVFEIPRLEVDSPEGNIRLIIHGRSEFSDPWRECRAAVDAWASLPLDAEF